MLEIGVGRFNAGSGMWGAEGGRLDAGGVKRDAGVKVKEGFQPHIKAWAKAYTDYKRCRQKGERVSNIMQKLEQSLRKSYPSFYKMDQE